MKFIQNLAEMDITFQKVVPHFLPSIYKLTGSQNFSPFEKKAVKRSDSVCVCVFSALPIYRKLRVKVYLLTAHCESSR